MEVKLCKIATCKANSQENCHQLIFGILRLVLHDEDIFLHVTHYQKCI